MKLLVPLGILIGAIGFIAWRWHANFHTNWWVAVSIAFLLTNVALIAFAIGYHTGSKSK